MKVIAINGSPRRKWNTAELLKNALKGAASQGAETELIHLYDLNFKGCTSCFACKLVGGKSYGRCAMKDDLTEVLRKIETADALILGSPIYFSDITGEMRSFLERLLFQYLVYDKEHSVLREKKLPTAFFYTMNVSDEYIKKIGYEDNFRRMQQMLQRFFGSSEYLAAADTYQFDDYSKYITTGLDEQTKARKHQEEFPQDCCKAFDLGVKFAQHATA